MGSSAVPVVKVLLWVLCANCCLGSVEGFPQSFSTLVSPFPVLFLGPMAVASEKALQGTVSTAPTVVDSSDSLNLFHSPSFFGANTAASEKVLLSLPPCVPLCAKRRFMPSLLLYYSLGVESRSILPRGGAVSTKSLRGVFDCIHNGWCDG